ncbi:MAG: sel1 repeat family protein [Akkermansiaceae bacterium]|nr:sel1 repeat family protein [Akkermansiaceae bacterium]
MSLLKDIGMVVASMALGCGMLVHAGQIPLKGSGSVASETSQLRMQMYECGVELLSTQPEKAFVFLHAAAQNGYVKAQFKLGTLYEDGVGCEPDMRQAVKWYLKAAMQDFSWAQSNLGICYQQGRGVPRNARIAFQYFRLAAASGDDYAQFNLARCYEVGRGCRKDSLEAAFLYYQAAEQGVGEAVTSLSRLLEADAELHQQLRERIQCEHSEDVAVEDEGEAEMNDAAYEAQQDRDFRMLQIRTLAALGDAEAQFMLSQYYDEEVGDARVAFAWCQKAAWQDLPQAQNAMGTFYEAGVVVPQNYERARYWYQAAAEQNFSLAMCNLGCLYENGRGVPVDYKTAADWYRKAIVLGDSYGKAYLALFYLHGYGVTRDEALAVQLLEQAVLDGDNPYAAFLLAGCCECGLGMEKHPERAKALYEMAAVAGIDGASEALERLNAELPLSPGGNKPE